MDPARCASHRRRRHRGASRLREDHCGRTSSIAARDYGASADLSHPTVVDNGGFGAAYERVRRLSRSTSPGSHKPGAIQSAIYRYAIDPHRTKRGGYTPEERGRAQRLTNQWGINVAVGHRRPSQSVWWRAPRHCSKAVQGRLNTRRRRDAPRVRSDRFHPRDDDHPGDQVARSVSRRSAAGAGIPASKANSRILTTRSRVRGAVYLLVRCQEAEYL
jgi:hypothetical protein